MDDFMKIAAQLAESNVSSGDGGPFGAVVVKDGVIAGRGNNRVIKDNDPTAHAEINAIRDACAKLHTYDLSGCVLYTSCYPCPMCMIAVIWSNIKTVFYGNTKDDAADIGFRDSDIYDFFSDPSKGTIELEQMGRDETLKAFNEFKDKKDKVIY